MTATAIIVLAIIASLALAACTVVMDRAKDDRESAAALMQQLTRLRARLADAEVIAAHRGDGWTRAASDVRRLRAALEEATSCVVCRRRLEGRRPCCEGCIDVERKAAG